MTTERPDWKTVIATCGSTLPAWIRHEVLALGTAARPALVEIVRNATPAEDDLDPSDDAPAHAATLLAQFPADDELIAICLGHLHDHPDRGLTWCFANLLAQLGPPVAPATLAAYGRLTDDDADEAGHLVDVLARCGARDPRIYAALLNALRRFPSQAAGSVGHYGDARAIEPLEKLIDEAEASWESDGGGPSNTVLAAASAIAMLGGTLNEERAARVAEETEFEDSLFDEPEEPHHAAPRPAPNAPCRCGSGRKYKKCHQAEDEGG